MDEFQERVAAYAALDDAAEPVRRAKPSAIQQSALAQLSKRAGFMARSVADRSVRMPSAIDTTDQLIDETVLDPNRRALARRTLAMERWLADRGFRGGAPVRMARAYRRLHHHGEALELPIARPVVRDSFAAADELVVPAIFEHVLGQMNLTSSPAGRVSVLPGFFLVEVSPNVLAATLGLAPLPMGRLHGVIALASTPVGPVFMATRDVSGDLVAHALLAELTHELAAVGDYDHTHPMPTPAELRAHPERGWQLPLALRRSQSVDGLAQSLVTSRLRHLPSDCQRSNALTLSDLGFAANDWLPVDATTALDPLTFRITAAYLASVLLGATLIDALNEHPEARSQRPTSLAAAFGSVECNDADHQHYDRARQYANTVRRINGGEVGPTFLDGIYRHTVDAHRDFSHPFHTAHSVQLRVYPAPLHPQH